MKANENKAVTEDEKVILLTVEELQKKEKTIDYVFSGLCAMKNWHRGKAVSLKEYREAVGAFLKSPMGGKKPC